MLSRPLPPGGYLGRKFLVYNGLGEVGSAKFVQTKGLRLKSCK
jgi:hypothetical protein